MGHSMRLLRPPARPTLLLLASLCFLGLVVGSHVAMSITAGGQPSSGVHSDAGESVSNEPCKPLLFVFGASMADTGEFASAMPFLSSADFPPYGVDYFSRPAGRWSNGRVLTDFITQGLGYGLLSPFLRSINSNFKFGANFASAGSTARTLDYEYMFPLGVQVDQFKALRDDLLTNQSSSKTEGYSKQQIGEAIYFFETGNNDYVYQFDNTTNFNQEALVSDVISAMETAFRELYTLGARNFLVMTLTPLGCSPLYMVDYASFEADEYGCITFFNNLCELHNLHLESLLSNLTLELLDANWILFDAYSIFLDGYHNPSRYGIQHPFEACCGAGGEHNYVSGIHCGSGGYVNGTYVIAKRCDDPSHYLIWDSIHPVESFARYIAEGVLTGNYLRPSFNITSTCFELSLIS